MERGLGSDSNATPGSIDKSVILEVKPLKTLVPIFPNSGLSPNTAAPPTGPFPTGVQPFYPFLSPNGPQHANSGPQPNLPQPNFGFSPGSIPAPVPLNSFRTPITQANGSGQPKRSSRTRTSGPALSEDDGYSDSQNPSDQYTSINTGRRRAPRRPKMIRVENGEEFDIESLVNHFLTLFKLNEFNDFRRSAGDSDTVASILSAYDFIRKKLTQLEESNTRGPGIARRPDLKAANFMMSKGVRTNNTKRIGHLHEFEIGDMFFFRMELCIVGLHAPSMAGIDYMSVRVTADEEPLAVSIVSSGGYDDDMDDCDVLIYSGQGGVQRRDGQMFDQKLERGNLALEKSLHRANDVRVVRGIKDIWTTGKIYVYDGIYRIQESWAEKNKLGCNVFKYKLVRVPGQPEGFSLWKSIQQWKDGIISRPGIILPDLTSGAESIPVALVNDVDNEKGPAHFTYVSSLRYTRPFSVTKPSFGCHCIGGCQPGDSNCPCTQRNDGGLIPYSSIGVLLTIKSPIYECGPTCACPSNCRNRTSQTGVKVRLEVFKTKSRGWGLRSWDPIRAGGFICEYAGDVIEGADFGNENDDDNSYVFDATREYTPLEPVYDSSKKTSYPLVISAKNNGNVARFMNHSCSPNVFWQPVLREGDSEVCLHVAFFAARHIPPMRELTYDYGKVANGNGEKGKKKCLCGTAKCKGYFY